jgi:peroxiredoxin
MLAANAEIPTNIRTLIDEILLAARSKPTEDRVETLLQLSSVLRLHFPDEAKILVLEAEKELSSGDDYRRSEAYRVMLDLDASDAAQIAIRIRDKNVLYSTALQHCAENHDVRCAEAALTKAHSSGAYRIAGTRWVIDQLVTTDPSAARTAFTRVLQLFPANSADFRDVQVLLDAAQAVAKLDLDLAKRAAEAIETSVENPQFGARTQEIVTARFLVDGKQIDTKTTRETVLVQTQSLLRRGSFPHLLEMQFSLKHPNASRTHPASRDSAIDALLQELDNRVQDLNDFTLKDLSGREYRLKALRGRPILLDFWATWCVPCRKEMPRLDALQRNGLTILAITDEDAQVVHRFTAANPYTFPILLDPQGEVFKLYGVLPRPTNILIDDSGRIADRWIDLPESDILSPALAHAGLK